MRLVENSNSDNLYTRSRPQCQVLWKAFSIPMHTAAINILLLKFRETWTAILIYWRVILWSARNWLAFSKFVSSSTSFWIVLQISLSNSLSVVDKRLIGRKFWGIPGFGRVLNFASSQGSGVWPNWKQWLNKCVKRTRGLLGRCRRRSFRMPSKAQAFPNFTERITFETSQGRKLTGAYSSTVAGRASTWASTCRLW
jgi:hypothetical protein